jgi:hypothetical protein
VVASNWIMYDSAKKGLCNGTIDFDTDSIKVSLHASGYTPDLTHDEFADATNELATANGYTAGGTGITGTVTNTGSTTKLSASGDATWTAAGGSIVARYAIMRKVGTINGLVNPLIGYCLLDTTPANVTATAGQNLIIATPTNGFWQLTGATS